MTPKLVLRWDLGHQLGQGWGPCGKEESLFPNTSLRSLSRSHIPTRRSRAWEKAFSPRKSFENPGNPWKTLDIARTPNKSTCRTSQISKTTRSILTKSSQNQSRTHFPPQKIPNAIRTVSRPLLSPMGSIANDRMNVWKLRRQGTTPLAKKVEDVSGFAFLVTLSLWLYKIRPFWDYYFYYFLFVLGFLSEFVWFVKKDTSFEIV